MYETIAIRDSVSILKIISDTFDEGEVIRMFNHINRLHKLTSAPNPNNRDVNLYQALRHYENAMKAPEILFLYRDLFNSLQQVVDVGGRDLTGTDFDNECNKLTGITLSEIEDMRRFFDRIKHIQKNSKQVSELQQGLDKFKQKIPCCENTLESYYVYNFYEYTFVDMDGVRCYGYYP